MPVKKIRYAVVGLGHIAQNAVLPAFRHAGKNSELGALVSEDPIKRYQLGRKYRVDAYSYEQYEQCLREKRIDAVYIALPNHLHREYAVRAAKAGVHVLCEKPMAVTEKECLDMIRAAEKNRVLLMIAYRLHFEEANLKAVQAGVSRRIGELRYFDSSFSMQVRPNNIRTKKETGGGTLYDIGIYCINAARYLFQSEPVEVTALTGAKKEARFKNVEESTGAVLRFPGDRMAVFVASFGASDVSSYRIVGTKGDLRAEPGYDYSMGLKHCLTVKGKTVIRQFPKRGQFASEIFYFSDCILRDRKPEPSGTEGLADVQVIRALYRSAKSGRSVKIAPSADRLKPSLKQRINRPPVKAPKLVRVQSPHF